MKKTAFILCAALSQSAWAGVFQSLGHFPTVPTGNYTAGDISDNGGTIIVSANEIAAKWTITAGLEQLPLPPGTGPGGHCDGLSTDGALISGLTPSPSSVTLVYPTVWTAGGARRVDDGVAFSLYVDAAGTTLAGAANDPSRGQPTAFIEAPSTGARQYLGRPVNAPDINPTSGAIALSNNAAVVVGGAGVQVPGSSPPFIRAVPFRWTAATGMVVMLNNGQRVYGQATDITPSGSIIVGVNFDTSQFFRWTEGAGFTFFPLLSGSVFQVTPKISADGETIICGLSVWTAARGVRPLQTVLTEAGCDFTG